MIKTLVSIFLAFFLIVGLGFYETQRVSETFTLFENALRSLYDKTEAERATYEDGTAVQIFWEEKKKFLQAWVPHSPLSEVDYQLYEAVGFLYVQDYKSALPKMEVLIGMCENIPNSYTLTIENIF